MKKFIMKNYSTQITGEKTILEIEILLSNFGACKIMKDMRGDGKVSALMFAIGTEAYKLPLNAEGVWQVLFGDKRQSSRKDERKNRDETAYRVACRLLKDWLHAQLSMTLSGQAEPQQILLPYLYNGHQTLYESYKEGRLQLPAACDNSTVVEVEV